MPHLHANFKKGVATLSPTYNKDTYVKFLDVFGTHYVNKLQMGARYGYLSVFTDAGWTSMLEKGIKVDVAASASYAGVSGKASVSTNQQSADAKTFQNSRENVKIFSLGSTPPTSGNNVEWANQAIAEPMPITYSLRPIDELFTTQFMPDVQGLATIR
jgi:hypothetical protein